MSSRVSLTSWGEGASLAFIGHSSIDGVTMKIPCVGFLLHFLLHLKLNLTLLLDLLRLAKGDEPWW